MLVHCGGCSADMPETTCAANDTLKTELELIGTMRNIKLVAVSASN